MTDYDDFVRSKRRAELATGHQPGELNEHLYWELACQNIADAKQEGTQDLFAEAA